MHSDIFVSCVVKEKKSKFLQRFVFKKQSPDLFDQFISVFSRPMAEREIDSTV